MRLDYSEDETFSGQFALWQANCRRSLHGKRGQASLKELEAALLALPKKRLIREELQDENGDVCPVGALAKYQGVSTAFRDPYDTVQIGVDCGMPFLVAWKTVEFNDIDCDTWTPEVRYANVLAWVQSLIGGK